MKTPIQLVFSMSIIVSCAQEPVFTAGTNVIHVSFQDVSAAPAVKSLFLSDLAKTAASSETGVSIETSTNAYDQTSVFYGMPPVVRHSLNGIREPKFTNGDVRFPSSLDWTNGVWTLPVSKEYTDEFSTLCTFVESHSNEIEKLRAFVTNDLAAERLAALSDDDIYEMYLSKLWTPGDRNGPSLLSIHDRPQIIRGTYYEPPVAAVLSWPMGPSDAPEHLWAQINVRVGGTVYETRAIYWSGKWWLTIWDWEEGDPVWTP